MGKGINTTCDEGQTLIPTGGFFDGPVAFDTTQITSAANYSNPKPCDPCHPLAHVAHPPAVAFDARQSDVIQYGEKTGPLDTDGHSVATLTEMQVRRLTPRECERLQGFPDDYTLTPYRGKPAADGPRYKALGNSMAVPCMHWIGKRIQQVQDLGKEPA
jgi:DNA (cytosine-5)-methyltransferase 1